MQKDDRAWLNIAYVAVLGLIYYVIYRFCTALGEQSGWLDKYSTSLPTIIVLASLAIAAVIVFFMRSDKEKNEYYISAIAELRKVSWPSFDDTKRMTVIVCIVVAILAVILAIFDFSWSWVLKQIIS